MSDVSVNGPTKLNPTISKWVWYESNAALEQGEAVCYNWDYTGDGATSADARRQNNVETPSTMNAQWFAGVAARAYSAKSSGQLIEIYCPGSVCPIRLGSATDTVIGVGLLTFDVTASYKGQFRYEGLSGEGSAQPLQTITNDGSTATCLAKLQTGLASGGVEVVPLVDTGAIGTLMIGGTTLITGGAIGSGHNTYVLADGTIEGLRKKFKPITAEITAYDVAITVTTGMRQDGTALQTITWTAAEVSLNMGVVLKWAESWAVTSLGDGEPDLA